MFISILWEFVYQSVEVIVALLPFVPTIFNVPLTSSLGFPWSLQLNISEAPSSTLRVPFAWIVCCSAFGSIGSFGSSFPSLNICPFKSRVAFFPIVRSS